MSQLHSIDEVKEILAKGEGIDIEFKESRSQLARKVYESICAFLNRKGGHIVLGANDDGVITGIDDDSLQTQLDTLAKDMNNPQLFRPTYYLDFEALNIDGKNIIHCYVPESTQAHAYKNIYYDRNQDGDFELRSTEQIANLFIRKSKQHTEERVYPVFGISDLDTAAFDYMRKMIKADNAEHQWLSMSDEEILRSGQMIMTDPESGKEGLTLAAILLFGKRNTIASVLPHYSTDVLCRVNDAELYDDRIQVKDNLMVAYQSIMEFVRKHLPEKPFIEDMQRFSLRDKIMREVVLNILIHREYSGVYPATFTIWADKVVTENWNVPYVYGKIDLVSLKPHRKNPIIANVFSQMGIVEELGSGTKKMFKYTPLYSDGQEPLIEEQDVYSITIPMQPLTVNKSLSSHQAGPNESLSWQQVGTKLALSWSQIEPIMKKMQEETFAKDLRILLGMKDSTYFKKNYLDPLIEIGVIDMTLPQKPTSPNQKYFLTEKGKKVLEYEILRAEG